jgi:DNA/RNA-binding domain of Phe-tRNA-synthetase-like protein
VREGEYATAENARAIPETISNFYNKVVAGTKLTPEQRKQLLGAAEGAFKGQVQTAVPRIKQYQELEKQIGAEPGEVVPLEDVALLSKFGATPTASTPPPQGMTKRVVQNGKTYEWNGSTYVQISQ